MVACPYVGLDPFGPEQADFFFARAFERDTVLNNLMAARLTLLYGASGVGKSSVLGAGLLHRVRESVTQALRDGERPRFIACVFPSLSRDDESVPDQLKTWTTDPNEALLDSLEHEIVQVAHLADRSALRRRSTLTETLGDWSNALSADFLIVLDQFEEYFLYHDPRADGGDFARELARAVTQFGGRSNFLISIREDALGRLERLKGLIPNLFGNYLRIDYLDRESARTAITGPVERYNQLLEADAPRVSVNEDLIEAILDGVQPSRSTTAFRNLDSPGTEVAIQGSAGGIDTSYLQLVMTRLWAEEIGKGSHELRLATLRNLGGVDALVRRHLDEATAGLSAEGRRVAARVLGYMVTPEGSKIALTPAALADWARLPRTSVSNVLVHLSGRRQRVLRSVPGGRFELYHDRLAPPVLEWTRKARNREDRARALRKYAGLFGLVLVTVVAVWFWHNTTQLRERNQALAVADLQMQTGYRELLAKKFVAAAATTKDALEAYVRLGESRRAAEALLQLGKANQLAKKFDVARSAYHDVEKLVGGRGIEYRSLYAAAVERTATLRESTDGFAAAEPEYLNALKAYEDAKDPQGTGRIRELLAVHAEQKARNFENARTNYRRALSKYELAGDIAGITRVNDALQRLSIWGYLRDLHTGKVFPLLGKQTIVGRDVKSAGLENDIPIGGNRCVSRRHLMLRRSDRTVEALRPRNGTTVDGNRLDYGHQKKLRQGDILVLANGHAMQFTDSRPETRAVPANAWAIFVDGGKRRYVYLTSAQYDVSLRGRSLQISDTHSDKPLVEIRRAEKGGMEFRNTAREWLLLSETKNPNQFYKYDVGFVRRGIWILNFDRSIRPVQLTDDKKDIREAGPPFQIVPMHAVPGCEP